QAEDGIRDFHVTGVQTWLFRSVRVRDGEDLVEVVGVLPPEHLFGGGHGGYSWIWLTCGAGTGALTGPARRASMPGRPKVRTRRQLGRASWRAGGGDTVGGDCVK